MNEYKSHQDKNRVAHEAWGTHNTHHTDRGKISILDSALMDELLHQSDEIKLLIINKLSESLIRKKLKVQLSYPTNAKR